MKEVCSPNRHFRYSASSHVFSSIAAVLVVGVLSSGAVAEITSYSASLQADVVQFVGGDASSTDNSVETFPETASELPIEALAGLDNFSGELELDRGGRAVASFEDPTLSESANPMELGVEAIAYSGDPDIAYEATSSTVESRDIELSTEELAVATNGIPNLVISTVFINGALLIWTDDAERDLTGVVAEFEFVVIHDTSTGGELTVFESEATVRGEPDGVVRLVNSTILEVELGGPELLEGVTDAETQALIEALNAAGRLHVAVLPTQSIQYLYFARAGAAFGLRAEARARAVNLPAGTGAAAVFGRSFTGLSTALVPFVGQPKATETQSAVNRAIRVTAPVDPQLGPLCGVFGLETPLLLFSGLATMRYRRRTKGPQRQIED